MENHKSPQNIKKTLGIPSIFASYYAKTIEKILGNDFQVVSSYGHITDLDSSNNSIASDGVFHKLKNLTICFWLEKYLEIFRNI